MKDFRTIKEIVEQLSMSDYECEGGFLKNNTAFIRLIEISKLNYQPKFQINENVYLGDNEYFIRGIRSKSASHPEPEIEYDLSLKWNHASTSNETNLAGICEKKLLSKSEYKAKKIEEAKALLKAEGLLS